MRMGLTKVGESLQNRTTKLNIYTGSCEGDGEMLTQTMEIVEDATEAGDNDQEDAGSFEVDDSSIGMEGTMDVDVGEVNARHCKQID